MLGLFGFAWTWQADLVSTAEAKQLSRFHGYYGAHPPGHTDVFRGVPAVALIVRPRFLISSLIEARRDISPPVCRCGDSYESHQHYRTGFDCCFCQCSHYGPALIRRKSHRERSTQLLSHTLRSA